MEMKNPKLTYMKDGKTISSELDEKTLNDILQSVLLAKPELSEYDAIKYLFYGLTPISTNSITYFELSFIDDMGFKCTIEKAKVKANNNNSDTIKRKTEMENKFLELEQKCRNGFTKYELNLLLDENTQQIGKSGYFGDYFLITYHAKQAIVYVDDYDAKVHLITPFYDAIYYHPKDWKADERFSRGDKTIIIRDNNQYNIISKKSKGKPLCNVWFKEIEDKTYFDDVIKTSYYNAISSNGDYVRLSTNGAVLSTEFLKELENCKAMSETDILNKWIKQNRLVVGGVGFVYRGGRTNIIPKDKAIEMFTKYQRDKCYYEIDWIIFNGEIALSLREYTESDMM